MTNFNDFDNVRVDKKSTAWYSLMGRGAAGVANTFTSLTVTNLTSGRIPYITTGGLFTDSATMTYDGTTFALGTNKFTVDQSTGNTLIAGTATLSARTTGQVLYTSTGGLVTSDATLEYDGTTFDVGAGNFTVAQASGNTVVAGTHIVRGLSEIRPLTAPTLAYASSSASVSQPWLVNPTTEDTGGRFNVWNVTPSVLGLDGSAAYVGLFARNTAGATNVAYIGGVSTSSGASSYGAKLIFGSRTGSASYKEHFSSTVTTISQASTISADSVLGMSLSYTPSGSTSYRVGMNVVMNAGYTGTDSVTAMQYQNASTSSPTTYVAAGTAGYYPNANHGIFGFSYGTNTGTNVGSFSSAMNGLTNYGAWSVATIAKASSTNVGVFASGRNTGSSGVGIGGYFSLRNTTSAPSFVSAALIADNDDQAVPIFLARDNGTTKFTIADGGAVTIATSLTVSNLTSGRVPYITTAGLFTDSTNFECDGTTVDIGSGKFQVTMATGITKIDSGATPTASQLELRANALSSLSLLSYAADNVMIGMDMRYTGGVFVAADTTAASIRKTGDALNFYFDGSLTPGNSYTPTTLPLKLETTGITVAGTASIPGQVLHARRYAAAYG